MTNKTIHKIFFAFTACLLLSGVVFAPAGQAKPVKRSLCVFDVIGTNGPVYNSMKKYQAAALEWGVKIQLKPYTDETVALEDFRNEQCDGVVLTGVRNRQLVKFAGSIDMMGALPTLDHLKKAIQALSRPRAKQYMRTEKYEVAGIFPAGSVYFFVRPEVMQKVEGVPSVDDFAGKKVAVLSYDEQAITAVREVGGTVVGADVTSFAGKFNNGNVDLCYAPAAAYKALELYKGLGEEGRIIDYTLAQVTVQMTLRRDRFPEEFGLKSRQWTAEKFDDVKQRLLKLREEIPEEKWFRVPEDRQPEYRALFRDVRESLVEDGVYDPKMVKLLRRVRCSMDASRAECTMSDEN